MKVIAHRAQTWLLRRVLPSVWWLFGETADSRSEQRTDSATPYVPRGFRMSVNTVMLMINAIISATLGYPFWLLATRLFDPAAVGLGSAAISAIRLCSQIGLLGIGAAVTLLLPRQQQHPSDLLNAAITSVTVSALIFGSGFLVLAAVFFHQFRFLVVSPAYALAFLALNVVSVLVILQDSIFIALRRADRVAARSIAQAFAAIATLGVASLVLHAGGVPAILLAWIGAFVASSLLGYWYLRRNVAGYKFRPLATRATTRSLLHVGIPQSMLNLSIAAPGFILPILVTEVLSPTSNAYWYIVWMFGGLVFAVPKAASGALFAESSHAPAKANQQARQSIRLCLILGLPMAAGMALFANWGLQLMGSAYAHAGATPLRILVLGTFPSTLIYAFISRERSANRTCEPTLLAISSGVLSVIGAVFGGIYAGLMGVAIAWVLAQFVIAVWAGWRLRDAYGFGAVDSSAGTTTDELTRLWPSDPGRANSLD
ncbi:MAG TPA: polysaccharide biosynthesis C-terminal domain-containing protein [Nitrolancea sp.]